MKLSLDFGSGAAQWLADSIPYNDGKWHTVSVIRDERHVKMDVDGTTVSRQHFCQVQRLDPELYVTAKFGFLDLSC